VLRFGDARLALPASLERPRGTVLEAVVERPGFEPQALRLAFDESGSKRITLKELGPSSPK
jgi:hypothetical protein